MKQAHLGGEPNVEGLRALISDSVYVSPEKAHTDLKRAQKLWAEAVRDHFGVGYIGEIRDYYGHPGPMVSGDLRDTWTLCVFKGQKLVHIGSHLPWAWDEEGQSEYESELAGEVAEGQVTLDDAKKRAQEWAENEASRGIEEKLEFGWDSIFNDRQLDRFMEVRKNERSYKPY